MNSFLAHILFGVVKKRAFLKKIIDNRWQSMLFRIFIFMAYRVVALRSEVILVPIETRTHMWLSLLLLILLRPVEILLTGDSKLNIYNGTIDFVQAARKST